MPDITKIKSLITSSPILSAQEREEWLSILGAMNEKQLADLERILAPAAQKSVPAQPQAAFAGGLQNYPKFISPSQKPAQSFSPKPPVENPPPAKEAAQAHLPKLSHIVNLPNLSGANYQTARGSAPSALSSPAGKPAEKIQTSNLASFETKLKNTLAEKELVAGHSLIPLASHNSEPPPANPSVKAPRAAAAVPPIISPKPSGFAPAVPRPKNLPHFPPAVAVSNPPRPASPLVRPLPPIQPANLKNQISQPSFRPPLTVPTLKPVASPLAQPKPPEPFRSAGVPTSPPPLSPQPAPKISSPSAAPDLDSLTGLASLDQKVLGSQPLAGLVKTLKGLISSHGYHEVLFNIEKSPLYKSYIRTGQELLSRQADFDQLKRGSDSETYLSREQFEKTVDLLTEIQTS